MSCWLHAIQAEATQAPGQPSNVACFKAKLEEPLTPGSSIDLEWYSVHVGSMTPFPAKASQSDPQRVLLKGSHYAPSPYPIPTQTAKASLHAGARARCLLSATMRSMHITTCTEQGCTIVGLHRVSSQVQWTKLPCSKEQTLTFRIWQALLVKQTRGEAPRCLQ